MEKLCNSIEMTKQQKQPRTNVYCGCDYRVHKQSNKQAQLFVNLFAKVSCGDFSASRSRYPESEIHENVTKFEVFLFGFRVDSTFFRVHWPFALQALSQTGNYGCNCLLNCSASHLLCVERFVIANGRAAGWIESNSSKEMSLQPISIYNVHNSRRSASTMSHADISLAILRDICINNLSAKSISTVRI